MPRTFRIAVGLLAAATVAGCGAVSESLPAGVGKAAAPEIRVLSNRADLVSGGDALVELVLPPGAAFGVSLNGRNVTSSFARRANGRVIGLLTGLALGPNTLVMSYGGGAQKLTITNHPLGGPVFAGPQILPWTCFAGATDAQCNREPNVSYVYMPADGGGFAAYDPASPPADVGTTTTDQGKTVPYIVRVETGAIDRDEYRIASLYDPSKPYEPWAPQDGFNGKLLINHGASCNTAYEQASAPDVMNEPALSRGFAVMSHALNNAGHNCNIAVQGEALIMTKEYLIERLGEVRYTIGMGCSGGAQVQYQLANAYPGLYQGITPQCSFPDSWSGKMMYEDYSLLRVYYENPSTWEPGVSWSYDQIAAVFGHPSYANAITYNTAISTLLDPSRDCPGLTPEQVYDPVSNPNGVRCSQHDYMVAIFGRRTPEVWTAVEQQIGKGFANRPWDNVGVQYGLNALRNGVITPAQFVDVNAKIGGRDIDYEPTVARAAADRFALDAIYRSGAVNTASNLNQTAIIDLRGPDPGAFHDVYRTYILRARLEREHGTAANQILWRGPVVLLGDATFVEESFYAMDRWLAAVEQDTRNVPYAQKLVEDRPADVTDRCTNGSGEDVPAAECDAVVESYTSPRIEAGMVFTDDVMKCQLQPLQQSDYFPIFFTAAQWATLEATFPTGVCDYTVPGVEQQKTTPWQTYVDGPGGRALGAPPRSAPL